MRSLSLGLICLVLCAVCEGSESTKGPFTLKNGVKYRDMLTLMASQAVADYADSYSRRQEREIQHNKAVNKNPVQSPKFYSLRLDTPTGVPAESNALYFSTSRHIKLDPKHKAERTLADKDEETIVAEMEGKAPPSEQTIQQSPESSPPISQLPSRRRQSSLRTHQQGTKGRQNRYLYQTATNFGPSSSYSIIRAPGINVGIDTNHARAPRRHTPSPKSSRPSHHTPSYSYTINTGAAYRHG